MTGHMMAEIGSVMRTDIHVRTDISGAKVVVMTKRDAYIEAKTDARYPGKSFIEFVRSGRVREKHVRDDSVAPELIIDLIRKHLS